MQLIVDFLPIIVFFAVYKGYAAFGAAEDAIFPATAALMIVMTIQITVQWIRKRTVNKMLLVSGLLALVLGSITLVYRDALFIQWKATIVYWIFSVACLASRYIGDKTLIERVLGEAVELPSAIWHRLNLMWVVSFALLGAANIYVVYNYSQATWVNFKLYGLLGLTLVMALIQGIWIARYLPDDQQTKPKA